MVQDISQIVLGRAIANELELEELLVALKGSKLEVQSKDIISSLSQIDVGSSIDKLPSVVADCLRKIYELDSKIASSTESFGTDAMMHPRSQEDRDKLIVQLKMLAVEHELDFEALLLTVTDSTKVPFIAR